MSTPRYHMLPARTAIGCKADEDPHGEWVRHQDHQAAIGALQRQVEHLREALDKYQHDDVRYLQRLRTLQSRLPSPDDLRLVLDAANEAQFAFPFDDWSAEKRHTLLPEAAARLEATLRLPGQGHG